MESSETFGVLFSDLKKYNAMKKALGETLYLEFRNQNTPIHSMPTALKAAEPETSFHPG